MAKIVVVGSCNIDITVECDRWASPGETIFGNRLTVNPGGKGANQAVAAARLGAEVKMVGCIGDDVYGQLVQKALKDNNVDVTYVKVLPGENSGTAHITVAENDNSIIVIKAANDLVSPALIDEAWDAIKEADIVLLQHEIPAATNAYVIEKCFEAGVPVMLNPAPVAPVPPELLAKVTYLTPNEHEAAILFAGQGKADILGRNQGKVIMTLGSKGVAYAEKGQVYNVPGFKVQPVDTTGAGDTFNGAFAVARANGKSMYESISFANAAAALSVQKLGAQGGMP
ncbi:MAG: ribokinase, partial [Phascolarctobacterium sp.]|nr:ribokinase [Phascolarctobacterium sp.]